MSELIDTGLVVGVTGSTEKGMNTISSVDFYFQIKDKNILTHTNKCDKKGLFYRTIKPDINANYKKLYDYLCKKENNFFLPPGIAATALSGGTDYIINKNYFDNLSNKEDFKEKLTNSPELKDVRECFNINGDALFEFLKTYKKDLKKTWFLGGKKTKKNERNKRNKKKLRKSIKKKHRFNK